MYPSGTKETKYPLERGGEKFTTGQDAVITTAEPFYTHTAWPSTREEEKYRPQTEERGETDITFQLLRIYRGQDPAVFDPANSYIIWSHASYIHF